MSEQSKHPLKPSELGALYPAAKTYDELQAERAAARHLRRSRLPKHPGLLIVGIIVALAASLFGLAVVAPYIIIFNIMLGVPVTLLLGIVWMLYCVGGISKINILRDQIKDDGQSDAGASHDQS